jgi:hypothetical protein
MFKILVSLLMCLNPANAQQSVGSFDQISSHDAYKNFILNTGAEKNVSNISQSASITTRTTSTPLEGSASFSIDATASGQTVKFTASTLSEYLKGQNCEAKFVFTGDASLYKAYVEQSSNKLTADLQLTNETNARSVSINFPCGTTLTDVRPVIESTSASAAAIKVDKVYLGLATNLSDTQISTDFIPYTFTLTNAGTATVSAGIKRIGDTAIVNGTITIGASLPTGTITLNMPSGLTINTAKTQGLSAGVASASNSGGTGSYTGTVRIDSSTSLLFYGDSNAGLWNATVPRTFVANDRIDFTFSVAISSWPSSNAIRVNQTPWFIDARLDGSNQSLGVVNVASFTEITNAGWTLTPVTGSAPVGVMCSGTNAATAPSTSATTCSAGSESVGINFEIPYPGNYEVCFSGSTFYEFDSSETILNNFQLVETPTNAQTITQSSNVYAHTGSAGGSTTGTNANNRADYTTCANFNFSSAGIKGIRLMYNQTVAGTPNNVIFLASATDKRPKFSVKQLSVPYPMPLVVGSVSSNSSGAERLERVTVTNSGTPTISTQSGSWISSITDGGVGIATLNVAAGIFSAAPSCTVSQYGGGGTGTCYISTTVTSTAVPVVCYNTSFALADRDFMVLCQGPR